MSTDKDVSLKRMSRTLRILREASGSPSDFVSLETKIAALASAPGEKPQPVAAEAGTTVHDPNATRSAEPAVVKAPEHPALPEIIVPVAPAAIAAAATGTQPEAAPSQKPAISPSGPAPVKPIPPARQPVLPKAQEAPPGIFTLPAELQAEKKELVGKADDFMIKAFDAGYNQFNSTLIFGDKNCIRLQFSNDEGDTLTKDLTVQPHSLKDIVLLKMGVQSYVLAQQGIEPLRHRSKDSGEVSIHVEDFIQLHAGDPAATTSAIKSSNGLLSLEIRSYDRREEKLIPLSLQLGLADLPENKEEALRRKQIVEDFLSEAYASGNKVTKREVMDHLRSRAGEKWQNANEQIYLEGYESATEFPFPQAHTEQKTMLQPVYIQRQLGGVNPSYVLNLTLRVYPDAGDRKKSYQIRHRAMNLLTSDEGLALARANKALKQFQTMLAAEANDPENRWAMETDRNGQRLSEAKVLPPHRIGEKKLDEFLREMTRYEDDLKVKIRNEPAEKNGRVYFSLQVIRGSQRGALKEPYNIRAAQIASANTEELFQVKNLRNGDPAPLEMECSIPAVTDKRAQSERIRDFADKVNSRFMETTGDHYAGVALDDVTAEIAGEKHLHQHNFKTAQRFFTEAVQLHLPLLGEDAAVSPAWHGGEMISASHSKKAGKGKARTK